jgi:hypothetical protein
MTNISKSCDNFIQNGFCFTFVHALSKRNETYSNERKGV